jgi:hypothetical protein
MHMIYRSATTGRKRQPTLDCPNIVQLRCSTVPHQMPGTSVQEAFSESFDPQTSNKKSPEWGLLMHSVAGGMRIASPQWGPTGATKKTLRGSFYAQRSGWAANIIPSWGPTGATKKTLSGSFYAQWSGWDANIIPSMGTHGATKKTLNGVFLCTAERVGCEYHPLNGDPRGQQKITRSGAFLCTAERVGCEYHPLNGDPWGQQKRP